MKQTKKYITLTTILGSALCTYFGVTIAVQASVATLAVQMPANVWDFTEKKDVPEIIELQELYTLTIPSLGIRTDVAVPPYSLWQDKDWGVLEMVMQSAMETSGAAAYPHSVLPGQDGAVFITAHSSPPDSSEMPTENTTLFEALPELETGDKIFITEKNTTREYTISRRRIVSPEDVQIVEQKYTEPLLKLITCYPVGTTTDRLVVTAKQTAVTVD